MKLDLNIKIIDYLKEHSGQKFTAKEIAQYIFTNYNDECREKQKRSKATIYLLDSDNPSTDQNQPSYSQSVDTTEAQVRASMKGVPGPVIGEVNPVTQTLKPDGSVDVKKVGDLLSRINGISNVDQQKDPLVQAQIKDLADAINKAVDARGVQPGDEVGNILSALCGMVATVPKLKYMDPDMDDYTSNDLKDDYNTLVDGASEGAVYFQCGDWQRLLIRAIQPVLDKYEGSFSAIEVFVVNGNDNGWTLMPST